jgi:hypothetical protein
MILPQYSLRKLLGIMVGFALFCLVVSWGVRGSSWAFGTALAGLSLAIALVVQGLLFWLVWLFATATSNLRERRAARTLAVDRSKAGLATPTDGNGA